MAFEHQDIRGEYWNAMPLLVGEEERFVPADALWEMKRRINAWKRFQGGEIDENALLQVFGNVRDTGDGIVAMRGGDVKIVPHSPALLAITDETSPVNYGIGHVEDPYPEVNAIPANIVKKKFNRYLRQGEAKDHEGWIALAQGEVQVVADYEDAIVGVRQLRGYSTSEILPFDVHKSAQKMHVERALGLGRFYGGYSDLRGGAFGRCLDDYGARLAGVHRNAHISGTENPEDFRVAPEAQSSTARSAVAPTVPSTASVIVTPQMNVNDLVERLYARLERVLVTRAVSREDLTQGVQEYLATLK